jgi:threonine dehydrogenase-like Zn-dependent dehydrogenase
VKAFRVEAPNRFGLVDIPEPEIPPDGALVRVLANGICGSDLDVLEGVRPEFCTAYPCILGHEFAGEIVRVGRSVADYRPGDRVVVDPLLHCMSCRNCQMGWTCHCEKGYDQLGFTRPGGMQELVAVPHNLLHRFPQEIEPAAAALAEPLSCAANGVSKADIRPGDSVVVIGLGSIGAGALQLSRLFSPLHLILVEVDGRKKNAALRLGATHFLDSSQEDVPEVVRRITGGRGANTAIDCSGNIKAVQSVFSCMAVKSRFVMIGIPQDPGFTIPFFSMLQNDGAFFASAGYTAPIWRWVLQLLANRYFDTTTIVTHRFPLTAVGDAFELLRSRNEFAIKITLCPQA